MTTLTRKHSIIPTKHTSLDHNGKQMFPGWFDWEILCDNLVYDLPANPLIVEVGVYRGRTAVYICELLMQNRPNETPTYEAIDLYTTTVSKNPDGTERRDYTESEKFFIINNLQKVRITEEIKMIQLPSHRALRVYDKNEIDLLIIDGDHTAWGCYNDIKLGAPCVKEGGVVVIHDYHNPRSNTVEVTSAVDLFIADNPQLKVNIYAAEEPYTKEEQNSIAWFKIPKGFKFNFRSKLEFEKEIVKFPPFSV